MSAHGILESVARDLRTAARVVHFDEPAHRYHTDELGPLPSVTQVLRHFFPHTYDHVPAATLEHKRQIGTAVHLATHLLDRGVLDEATVAPEVAGYVESWRRFVNEQQAPILATEIRLAHPRREYAGTIDKVIWTPSDDQPVITVLDLKTGDPKSAKTHLQTAAYAELVRAALTDLTIGVRRAALQLDPDGGRAKLSPYFARHDFRRFAALRDAFTVIEQETPRDRTAAVA